MGRLVKEPALDTYRIGARVRRLRLRKKISLEELGRHTALSPALLSKLERNRVTPTLPTLLRIAAVFGIGLEAFFVREPPQATVVRADERLAFPERQDATDAGYDFEALNFHAVHRPLDAYLARFRMEVCARQHAHDATEFLHVLSGRLRITVEDDDFELDAGDSIHIVGGAAHGYARVSEEDCVAIVVLTVAAGAAVQTVG